MISGSMSLLRPAAAIWSFTNRRAWDSLYDFELHIHVGFVRTLFIPGLILPPEWVFLAVLIGPYFLGSEISLIPAVAVLPHPLLYGRINGLIQPL